MEQNNEKIAVNIGNYTGEALMMCWLKFVRLRPTLQSWKHNT